MPRIRAENIAQHKAQTRAAILDAAEDALVARGYDDVSLGFVADLAGLPRSTIYDYFRTRNALFGALVDDRVPMLFGEWMAMYEGSTPSERLEGLFAATFRLAALHPRLASVLLSAGRAIPRERHDELVPIVHTLTSHIRHLVRQGIESGEFVAEDPNALAEALIDLLAGGIGDIVGRDRPRLPLEPVLAARIGMIRGGIGSVPLTRPDSHS
jgi:AcrR family transcriptional regulator